MAESTGEGKARRWSETVRRRAEEIALETDLSAAAVRAQLGRELGADVPLKTVGRWVLNARPSEAIDRRAVIGETADRAALLLRAEVVRLEQASARTRDLTRLEQVVKALKGLESLSTSKSANGPRTLNDLSAPASEQRRGEAAPAAARRAA